MPARSNMASNDSVDRQLALDFVRMNTKSSAHSLVKGVVTVMTRIEIRKSEVHVTNQVGIVLEPIIQPRYKLRGECYHERVTQNR